MRFATYLAMLLLAVVAVDKYVNDSRLYNTANRNIVDYGRKPAVIADAAFNLLAPH